MSLRLLSVAAFSLWCFMGGWLFCADLAGGGCCSSSYHGYWAKDIWALNAAFGDENDLVELSAELHARDMVSEPGHSCPCPV